LAEYRKHEGRYRSLERSHPQEAARLLKLAEKSGVLRWAVYEEMATRNAAEF
jgi:pyruvate-ferredoxin/flavodoxin oxidoreductase